MVPVDLVAREPIVIRLVVGVIVNTMDQDDGFKMHAMKHNGKKTTIQSRKKIQHPDYRSGYRTIWKFGLNAIRPFDLHKSLHCIQNS